jgi:hypothetical protein
MLTPNKLCCVQRYTIPKGHRRMPKRYIVRWEELVLDGEDNPESVNAGDDITVTAPSLDAAKREASRLADAAVSQKRAGQSASGFFTAHVYAIVDPNGKTHQVDNRYVILDGCFTAQR